MRQMEKEYREMLKKKTEESRRTTRNQGRKEEDGEKWLEKEDADIEWQS